MNLPQLAGWCFLTIAPPLATQPGQGAEEVLAIRLGEARRESLIEEATHRADHPAARGFRFVAPETSRVTISAESYAINAYLSVFDAEGELLAEDADGGIEQNARLVLDLEQGDELSIVVSTDKHREGEVKLEVSAGEVELPSGEEALAIQAHFYRVYAERYLERLEPGNTLTPEAHSKNRENAAIYYTAAAQIENTLERLHYARTSAETAIELWSELGNPERLRFARSYLGLILTKSGHHLQAIELLEPILASFAPDEDPEIETIVLDGIGRAQKELGHHEAAHSTFEELIEVTERIGDPRNVALARNRLGGLLLAEGRSERALEENRIELEIARLNGDGEVQAHAERLRASIRLRQGRSSEALQSFERSLELTRSPSRSIEILIQIGYLHEIGTRYGAAMEAFEDALSGARRLGNEDAEFRAMYGVARVLKRTGELQAARRLLEEAEALAATLEPRLRCLLLIGLGTLRIDLEDFQQADAALRDALALASEIHGPQLEALCAYNLGYSNYQQGLFGEAHGWYTRAMELARSTQIEFIEAVVLIGKAQVLVRLGRNEEAAEAAHDGLSMARALDLNIHVLSALEIAAEVALARDELESAFEYLEELEAQLDRPALRERGLQGLLGLRASMSDKAGVAQDTTARVVERAGGDPKLELAAIRRGFAENCRWKGRMVLEGIAEHRQGRRSVQSRHLRNGWREAEARVSEAEQRLSLAILGSKPPATIELLREERDRLADQASLRKQNFRRSAPREAGIDVPVSVAPEDLQKQLSERDLLIDFVAGRTRLYAYVLTRERFEFLDLGEREGIESDTTLFLTMINAHETRGSTRGIAKVGGALYTRLLEPALNLAGEGIERLIVIPDPLVAGLPFEALVRDGGSQGTSLSFDSIEFVLDRFEVHYTPSAPVLLELANLGPRPEPGRTLVLADPIYPAESETSGSAPALQRLPGTRLEALSLCNTLIDQEEGDERAPLEPASMDAILEQRTASLERNGWDLYLGQAANPEPLRGDLRGYSIIHLAAHGLIDPSEPGNSKIILSSARGQQGQLTLTEILDLDLDAELTVLSACETGSGRVRKGDGVQSLARAFLYAGSRSVIASLWKVSDREAMLTMQRFYESHLGGKLTPGRALRAAKLALRRREDPGPLASLLASRERGLGLTARSELREDTTAHPYYWAPFVLIGALR